LGTHVNVKMWHTKVFNEYTDSTRLHWKKDEHFFTLGLSFETE
jgi:hypothetical protein